MKAIALYLGAVSVVAFGLGCALKEMSKAPPQPSVHPVWADSALGRLYGVRVGPSTACFVLVTPRGSEQLSCMVVDFGGVTTAPTGATPPDPQIAAR